MGEMRMGIPAPHSCLPRTETIGYLHTGDLPAKQLALTCLLRAFFYIYTKYLALQRSCSNTPAADGFPKANTTPGFGQRGGRRETTGNQQGTEASKQAHSISCPCHISALRAQHSPNTTGNKHSTATRMDRTSCVHTLPSSHRRRTLPGRAQAVLGLGTLCRSSPAAAPMYEGSFTPTSDQLCPEGNEAARSKSSLMFYPKERAALSFSFPFIYFCAWFFFFLVLFYRMGEGAGGK